jgi:hypothetical protein
MPINLSPFQINQMGRLRVRARYSDGKILKLGSLGLKQVPEADFQGMLAVAFLAISDRCSAVRLSARAFPLFLPIATAAGSRVSTGLGCCPVAMSIIDLASWLGFLERLGVIPKPSGLRHVACLPF